MSTNDPKPARRQPSRETTVRFEIQAPAPGEESSLERAQAEAIREVMEFFQRERPATEPEDSRRSEHD